MAEILDYFDRINIDVAKRKYYNVNKVNTVLEELRGLAEELVEENERQQRELVQLRASRPAMFTVSIAPWLRRMVSTSPMREATEGLLVSIMRSTSRVLV